MAKKAKYFMQYPHGEIICTTNPDYHKEAKQLSQKEGFALYRQQIITRLKKSIKPGTTVYTKLEAVASSGMSRRLSVYIVKPADDYQDSHIADITHSVAQACGYSLTNGKSGLTVKGCGMDAGFDVVYNLGRNLWPNGTDTPHGTRNGEADSDGGYALKHSWL